jgi:thiamine-triphosphatase
MAIEVEKKFILDNSDKNILISGAESIGTKIFTDIYYDNGTYDLTCNDIWLRERDGQWELKLPLKHSRTRIVDEYRELETESEIIEYFHFSKNKPLSHSLAETHYRPFASLTTKRSKYKKDGFIIDLDSMDFGYEIAEIEKMVNTEAEIPQATERILEFAKKYDLQTGQVRGKLIEYLRRNDKKHFDALVDAGVVLL